MQDLNNTNNLSSPTTTSQTDVSSRCHSGPPKFQRRPVWYNPSNTSMPFASMEAFNSVQSSAGHIAIDMTHTTSRTSPQSSFGYRPVHEAPRPYPYFPPRRPIQRSLFADDQPPNPLPESITLEPFPTQVSSTSKLHDMTNHMYLPRQARPYPPPNSNNLSTTSQSQPRFGAVLSSQSNRAHVQQTQPLTSPLKSFFDFTVQNLYSGLTHLQSAWNSTLYKERKEKEVMKAQYLKMQRERDIALERARNLERKHTSASYFVVEAGGTNEKRPYEDEGDEHSYLNDIQLPTPPPSGTIAPLDSLNRHLWNSSPVEGGDPYSLVYPTVSSTSPSPPPPPISGRQIFLSTIPLTDSCSSLKQESVDLTSVPRRSQSSSSGSDRESIRSSSSSSSSKRRRLSAESLSSHSSGVTAFEVDPQDDSSKDIAPFCAPPVPDESNPTSSGNIDSDDGQGECDMDISDTDSSIDEMNSNKEAHTPNLIRPGKKLLFDEDDEGIPVLPFSEEGHTSSSTLYAIPSTVTHRDTTKAEASAQLDLPRLNLRDLNRMYFNYSGIIYCRACCSRKPGTRWRCSSPLPLMDARQLDLDVLMNHCTSQHPVAYSDVAGLTLDQVFRLQNLLKANVSSGKTASTI
ncbi:hypothetical protein GGU10DRAFT_353749 [Lentinula aff. detonsa]|uniref:Uncharacterized protein n=1 Tax=Lentinula aff. detonsa TaxID=2804958 RepID=A0AA38NM77_9AGAR|nr:hypothetical protein GGU10DRAFT_353749 [Lentinula aff. detonsa]